MEEEKIEVVKKPYSKEKIGVTVMLVGLTVAIFLAIGFWAGTQSERDKWLLTPSDDTSTGETPPIPSLPDGITPTASTTDETADWKTYSNDTYGFSFKYPADWTLDDTASSRKGCKDVSILKTEDNSDGLVEFVYCDSISNAEISTLSDYVNDTDLHKGVDNTVKLLTTVKSSPQQAYGYFAIDEGDLGPVENYEVAAERNGHIYFITFGAGSPDELENQIFSTFQFTK